MRGPFFVEVLSRNNEVRYRLRLDELPISIGRGYDNDFILDDRHASAHHAVMEQEDDGGLRLRDLGSRNGIIHKGKRKTELPVDGDTLFRLGHTTLRVRSADFQVGDEIADTAFYDWEGWPPALIGLTLITGLSLALTRLGDVEKFEVTRYLISVVSTLFLGMIWCGVWAFANRLFGGRARLGRHLFILGCGFAAITVWNFLRGAVAYALSLEIFTRYGSHIVIAIIACMIFFHLLHVRPHRARLFAVACVILSMFGSGLMLIINYGNSGRLADELFMHERLPPALRLSPDRPVSQFIDDAEKLKARVDMERTEPVGGNGEEGWQDAEADSE